MLEGIVEMDESYFGGRPRRRNPPDNVANLGYRGIRTDEWKYPHNKRGRGADKVKVVGMVERGVQQGRVVLKVEDSLTGADMLRLLKKYVKMKRGTTVMTDDFKSYNRFDKVIQHYTVNHSNKQYVKHIKGIKDSIHTNTIEGVWSIIKNGIRGQYHVLSKKYLPFYLAEAAYKYNRRSIPKQKAAFGQTLENAITDEKCAVRYKPKGNVRKIAYGEENGECATPTPKHTGKRRKRSVGTNPKKSVNKQRKVKKSRRKIRKAA
jgi:transposase-like protein